MEQAEQNAPEPTLLDLAATLDKEGMIGFTRRFHEDIQNGFDAVNTDLFPWLNDLKKAPWTGILCLGMGGSAAGGDFLAALAAQQGGCPVVVHRDYDLPAWFDATWLVLATSHSGNTEETVAAAEAALKRDATVIVIATGGVLADSLLGRLLGTSSAVNSPPWSTSVCCPARSRKKGTPCWRGWPPTTNTLTSSPSQKETSPCSLRACWNSPCALSVPPNFLRPSIASRTR